MFAQNDEWTEIKRAVPLPDELLRCILNFVASQQTFWCVLRFPMPLSPPCSSQLPAKLFASDGLRFYSLCGPSLLLWDLCAGPPTPIALGDCLAHTLECRVGTLRARTACGAPMVLQRHKWVPAVPKVRNAWASVFWNEEALWLGDGQPFALQGSLVRHVFSPYKQCAAVLLSDSLVLCEGTEWRVLAQGPGLRAWLCERWLFWQVLGKDLHVRDLDRGAQEQLKCDNVLRCFALRSGVGCSIWFPNRQRKLYLPGDTQLIRMEDWVDGDGTFVVLFERLHDSTIYWTALDKDGKWLTYRGEEAQPYQSGNAGPWTSYLALPDGRLVFLNGAQLKTWIWRGQEPAAISCDLSTWPLRFTHE